MLCLEDSVQHHMATSLRIQPLDDVRHLTRCTVVDVRSVVGFPSFVKTCCKKIYLAIQNDPPCVFPVEQFYSTFGFTNTSFFVAL